MLTGDNETPSAGSRARMPAWLARSAQEDATQASHSTPVAPLRIPSTDKTPSPNLTSPRSSRFGFLASPMSAFKNTAAAPVAVPQDDELMYLDIESALFPSGMPNDKDTFSPAAFKNLQMNAVGLLNKYQMAYQQRTIAFQEIRAERDAQSDEKEEVETRTQHLKNQLEGMARKAAEQEAVMQALMDELKLEKQSRIDEKLVRGRDSSTSEGSTVSEDLGAEHDQMKRRWRKSDGTLRSDCCDTEDESLEGASVFSRSRSPTLTTMASETSPIDVPVLNIPAKPASLEPPRVAPRSVQITPQSQRQPPSPAQPQISAFQRLFRGGGAESPKTGSANGCNNCKGQEASIAWDTVGLLRDENKGLKQRVGELEEAVEGALDVVNGIPL